MRVRPATPLSIIFLAAFVLLLLSVLSTPVIHSIHLGSWKSVTFGVFGFCRSGATGCSGIRNGYNIAELEPENTDPVLPSGARTSLTYLLIFHPIAAFFTLVCFILSLVSHLKGPSHSPRYLLALVILCLPAFVLSLVAFLLDLLIFLPHVEWGAWIVLGATVLIALAGVVTCGMRRTIVSKVARRKRIEETVPANTDYYAQQQQVITVPPPASSANGTGSDKLPEFATFEVETLPRGEPEGERIPLNPRSRTVSPPPFEGGPIGGASRFNEPSLRRAPSDRSDGYGPPQRGAGPLSRPMPPGQVRNQYSNNGMNGNSGPYGPPPQQRGYGPPGNGYGGDRFVGEGPPGYRGPPNGPGAFNPAIGLGPPPRRGPGPGQYGPRGPPPGMGGQYGMGPQGGMGPRGMGSDNGMGPRGMGPDSGMGPRGMGSDNGMGPRGMGPDNGMGPRGMGPDNGMGPRGMGPDNGMGPRGMGPDNGMGPRGMGPDNGMGPRGMGSDNGMGPRGMGPDHGMGPRGMGPDHGMGPRGMGPDNGMGPRGMRPENGLGLQGGMMMGPGPGGRRPMPQPPQQRGYDYPADEPHVDEKREFEQTLPPADGIGVAATTTNDHGYNSYHDDGQVPAELGGDLPREPSPQRLSLVNDNRSSVQYEGNEYVPPRAAWNGQTTNTPPPGRTTPSPVELPGRSTPVSRATVHPRPSDSYYEDVAPAFDDTHLPNPQTAHPTVLVPGGATPPPSSSPFSLQIPDQQVQHSLQQSVEELREGQRSPAMSTASNFTSISQRPMNPNWQPGYVPPMPGMPPQRRGPTSSQLLGGNPDFELPGAGPRGKPGRGMGR